MQSRRTITNVEPTKTIAASKGITVWQASQNEMWWAEQEASTPVVG